MCHRWSPSSTVTTVGDLAPDHTQVGQYLLGFQPGAQALVPLSVLAVRQALPSEGYLICRFKKYHLTHKHLFIQQIFIELQVCQDYTVVTA
jgi:hypothetical protein